MMISYDDLNGDTFCCVFMLENVVVYNCISTYIIGLIMHISMQYKPEKKQEQIYF